jgi:Ca2+/Na+ antiporter
MFFFKSQRWIITVVSGYIAMFLLLIIVVSGSDNLLKNLEKIEKELKDLLRKYKNEN